MPLLAQTVLANTTLTLGLLITAALFGGIVGTRLRLPKVTSYLLIGTVLGSSVLGWIPNAHIEAIKPLTKLAIALVLLNLGCHFPLSRVRRILPRALHLSAGELSWTFLLVTLGMGMLGLFGGGGIGWDGAMFLGALALATAPATTILVLKEMESEGRVTDYTNCLVAINNLASIVLFELLFLAILLLHGRLAAPPLWHLGQLLGDLLGSVALGVVAGLAVSYSFALTSEGRRVVLLVGIAALTLGICLAAKIPYLLAFLTMGVTVANSSRQTRQIVAEMDKMTGLLCVVFFVTHGAELDVHELWKAGSVGMAYIGLRCGGKYFGVRWAAERSKEEPHVREWLGAALLAQAGAAIALADLAVDRTLHMEGHLRNLFGDIQTVILGTVVVFEIGGPLLIRQAVLQSGEVPLAHAIRAPGVGLGEQLRTVFNRLLVVLGRDPWSNRSADELLVSHMVRKNVNGLLHSATFDGVVAYLEHSRDNTIPVVDENGVLVGVIRYRELSHALCDGELGPLVVAADLMTPTSRVMFPDEPLSRASALFASSKDDCIPVVDEEGPRHLLGVVRRRDVLRVQVRGQGNLGGTR
jgi:Kef-type K+ transport system membrane component KefB